MFRSHTTLNGKGAVISNLTSVHFTLLCHLHYMCNLLFNPTTSL